MAREPSLRAAWTPPAEQAAVEEQSQAAEAESRRQFYELASRQLRAGGQAG